MTEPPLLEVRRLSVRFPGADGDIVAVDGIDLAVAGARRLGIVGESGSGKSVTAASILGLVDPPAVVHAEVMRFGERDLTGLDERAYRAIRGRRIGLVMQDPSAALSAVYPIGEQIAEAIRFHEAVSRRQAQARAVELLETVGMPDPERRARQYPHELSGGQRQRVAIASALAADPELLIADEPTTALDVTVQAQILELLRRLSDERGMAVILISHDLRVVADFAHDVMVMYGGRVMERGPAQRVYDAPSHPYTRALLAAQPTTGDGPRTRLVAVPGAPPDRIDRPAGCVFHPRCPVCAGRPVCADAVPELQPVAPGRSAACHFAEAVR